MTIEAGCTCNYWYEATAIPGADLLCGEPSPDCPLHGHWCQPAQPNDGTGPDADQDWPDNIDYRPEAL